MPPRLGSWQDTSLVDPGAALSTGQDTGQDGGKEEDTWSRPEDAQRAVSLTRGLMGSTLLRVHLEKRELLHSFIHSFIHQPFIEYLHAEHCARQRGNREGQTEIPHGTADVTRAPY